MLLIAAFQVNVRQVFALSMDPYMPTGFRAVLALQGSCQAVLSNPQMLQSSQDFIGSSQGFLDKDYDETVLVLTSRRDGT